MISREKRGNFAKNKNDDVVFGRNAVIEAIKSGIGINKVILAAKTNADIAAMAKERGLVVEYADRTLLDKLAAGGKGQGAAAYVAPINYVSVEDILQIAARKSEPPLLLLLDEIEDPHNLGALIRTADAAGVDGVLLPKRRSAQIGATAAKTSAGAIFHLPVAHIGNITKTLEELKEKGFWVAGADMSGEKYFFEADFSAPMVVVIGSEGRGIGRLVKEHCDFLVKIPMLGKINSLNASAAGAIIMYEARRQRMAKAK